MYREQVSCRFCYGRGAINKYGYRYQHVQKKGKYQYTLGDKYQQCDKCKGTGVDKYQTQRLRQRLKQQQAKRKQRYIDISNISGREQLTHQRTAQQYQTQRQQKQRAINLQKMAQQRARQQQEQWNQYIQTPEGKKAQYDQDKKWQRQERKQKCMQLCKNIFYCCGDERTWKKRMWLLAAVIVVGVITYLILNMYGIFYK